MIPFLVTLSAGLSTVLGAVLVRRVRNTDFGAFSLSFATGIMLMIALGELLPEALESVGVVYPLICVVAGALLSLILDIAIPHHHHHDEHTEVPGHYIDDCDCVHEESVSRGMMIALVLHNILEGLATGTAVVSNVRLGINMAIGIAIHNIPIGTTLAISMLSAGKSRAKALLSSTLVGLSQPLGTVLGLAVFTPFLNDTVIALCNAVVAGILVFVAFDELWPAARKSGCRNLTIVALLIGICFVPFTELVV